MVNRTSSSCKSQFADWNCTLQPGHKCNHIASGADGAVFQAWDDRGNMLDAFEYIEQLHEKVAQLELASNRGTR